MALERPMLLRFMMLYSALFSGFGFASPFLPAFLAGCGLEPEELGFVLGAATALRLVCGPIAGRPADRFQAFRVELAVCGHSRRKRRAPVPGSPWVLACDGRQPPAGRGARSSCSARRRPFTRPRRFAVGPPNKFEMLQLGYGAMFAARPKCERRKESPAKRAPLGKITRDIPESYRPPDHLGIGRKSRQFLPAQASCRDPGTGPSCASHRRSSEREWSLRPEFGWISGNLRDLSKGYFATTFLSSSLTCPATQSVSRKCSARAIVMHRAAMQLSATVRQQAIENPTPARRCLATAAFSGAGLWRT